MESNIGPEVKPERFEVGYPYTVKLVMEADKLQGKNSAPTTESYLNELNKKLKQIADNGGNVVSVLSGVGTYGEKRDVNIPVNVVQVVGDATPRKIKFLVPGYEMNDKTYTVGSSGGVDRYTALFTRGLIVPRSEDTRREISRFTAEEWMQEAEKFLNDQDGLLVGVIEARTMNTNTGKIETRKFLLLD